MEGLAFVVTGVLESLEREQAADLIKKYGGKVTVSISGRTSYIVVGEDAGVSKLAKVSRIIMFYHNKLYILVIIPRCACIARYTVLRVFAVYSSSTVRAEKFNSMLIDCRFYVQPLIGGRNRKLNFVVPQKQRNFMTSKILCPYDICWTVAERSLLKASRGMK